MLEINISNGYKSVTPSTFELPNFSVITGKNGSGKTHLLLALADASNRIIFNGRVCSNRKLVNFGSLIPSLSFTEIDKNNQIKYAFNVFNDTLNHYIAIGEDTNVNNLFLEYLNHEPAIKTQVERVLIASKKALHELTIDDFADFYNPDLFVSHGIFSSSITDVFLHYQSLLEENERNEFLTYKKSSEAKPFLKTEEFVAKYGIPPWEALNSLLKQFEIPYSVNYPTGSRYERFVLTFQNMSSGKTVNIEDFSTGEKVLVAIILTAYNKAGFYKPDLLLLDEPDAGLHPSMSKKMIEGINEFVVAQGIPTIITSHSPTTIIASNGIAVFEKKNGLPAPNPISVQMAVDLLSSDIPFLRISNDKRRQVFVESLLDVQYYERLTNIANRVKPLFYEPLFIPARSTSGSNCEDVKRVVPALRESGNDMVYGIIDRDVKAVETPYIKVLGLNERYAIENFILDPFLVGLFLVHEGAMLFSDFGIHTIHSYTGADKGMTQELAQEIVDCVLTSIDLHTSNNKTIRLWNSWKIQISIEFLEHNGHDLEKLYKFKYGNKLKKYHKENALKIAVIDTVINDYPQFTTASLFETLHRIK